MAKFEKRKKEVKKSTKQIEKEYNVDINIGVFEAIKTLMRERKEITSSVELNVGGLKVRLTDKDYFLRLLNNEIDQLKLHREGEPSTYDA